MSLEDSCEPTTLQSWILQDNSVAKLVLLQLEAVLLRGSATLGALSACNRLHPLLIAISAAMEESKFSSPLCPRSTAQTWATNSTFRCCFSRMVMLALPCCERVRRHYDTARMMQKAPTRLPILLYLSCVWELYLPIKPFSLLKKRPQGLHLRSPNAHSGSRTTTGRKS